MLKNDKLYSGYGKKLRREGILNSLGLGLAIGSGTVFVVGLVAWLCGFFAVWLPLSAGALALALSSVLLYCLKYRPDDRDIARRVDSMGLEERTVTMLDFENDPSYIAKRQRDDARARVSEVSPEAVKRSFPLMSLKKWTVAVLCVALFLGCGMTTVVALTDTGTIPSPDINGNKAHDVFFTVTYLTDGGGDIEGEPDQTVASGEDAKTVVAIAEDGWMFVRWSDGEKSPARTDRALDADLEVTAIFEEIGDGSDSEDGDGNGSTRDDGDVDKNVPDDSKTDGSSTIGSPGGDGGSGSSDGDKGDGSGSGDGGQPGEGKGNGRGDGAGGGWSDGNQVIDGKTDYRDVYDQYYDMAMEIIRNGGELPDYLKEFIEKYYGSI